MNWDEVSKALDAPLDPAAVRPPPQGKYGEYIDGFHAITEANRIFGHGNWSYHLAALQQVCRHEAQDRNGNPQIRVGYLCRASVNVDGVTREGAAVGSGMAKPDNEADAHESAVKEAETDALKRALRSFGYTFGLALYDKTKANVKAPFDAAVFRDRFKTGLPKCKTQQQINKAVTHYADDMQRLKAEAEPMYLELQQAITARLAEVHDDPAHQAA